MILHRIWGEQKFKYKAWAVSETNVIAEKPQPLEQEFWRLRDVDIIKMPLDDYIDGSARAGRTPDARGE